MRSDVAARSRPAPWSSFAVAAAAVALLAGCPAPKVSGGAPGSGGASGGASGPGAGGSAGTGNGGAREGGAPDFGFVVSDARPGEGGLPGDEGMACVAETHAGQQIPVDLLLLTDSSSSMLEMVGGRTKWSAVQEALLKFVRDPRSAGLGVGLQFFPQPGNGSPCQNELDCGFVNGPTPPACQPTGLCASATGGMVGQTLRKCGVRGAACPGGAACMPGGRCSTSGGDCTNIGQPCGGGAAGDMCTALGRACDFTDAESCSTGVYERPAVPLSILPAPGELMVARGLSMRSPGGGTPMGPALQGTLAHLRAQAAARAGRRAFLVLTTDGHPSGCTPTAIPALAGLLSGARAPAGGGIDTYVIGVFNPTDAPGRAALEQLAMAGGTGMPFLINPMDDLAQRFLDALNQIRGQALPCEFMIPTATRGPLDYGKVNLQLRSPAGDEIILYTGGRDRCDPVRGGWYYDVNPMMGTPTRIIACEATCRKLKAQMGGRIDLRIGCKTEVIQ